jgi:probable phosphoglycerate mutase
MTETKKITRFGLIRHAQTQWNLEKKIQGHGDSPLTAEGKSQAARWGRILNQFSWDRILASDTGRALETAKMINGFLKIWLKTDSRIREQDWGRWAGKTISQIDAEIQEDLAEQVNAGWDFCPPGGEDRRCVLKRSQRALTEAATAWPGDNILVVSHEGVIKCIIYHLCGRKFLPIEPSIIKPYRLHRVAYDNDGLRLEKINAIELEPSYETS